MTVKKTGVDDDYDPGAIICGHAPRHERHHYFGGGLWVCFQCFAKAVIGPPPKKDSK
jgi:hypothetical protein